MLNISKPRSRRHGQGAAALASAALLGLLFTAQSALAAEQRSMDEQTTVNTFTGALMSKVPITAPPFRGLEPKLALQYNSQAGNGYLGVGWGLQGFGTVERVSPGHGLPRWDATDVFALDGNDLIAGCTTFGGTHCTRIESYQRIAWDGTANAWRVTARDGTRSTYTPVITTAAGTLRWGLAEVRDTMDRVVTYSWTCASGVCQPSAVSYNGMSVTVYWEARPDVITQAVGGALSSITQRIKTIVVKVGSSVVRAYSISYQTSTNTQRSWLQSVSQYGMDAVIDVNGVISAGTALPAVVFNREAGYTTFGTGWATAGWADAAGWANDYYYKTIVTPDVTGDGKADVCYRDSAGIACNVGTGLGFGTSFRGPALSDAAGWTDAKYYKTIAYADVDGDGKADVCYRGPDGIACAVSSGAGFGAPFAGPAWSDANGWGDEKYYSTIRYPDVNGDGKADICGRDSLGIQCCLGTGTGFGSCFRGPSWADADGCGVSWYYGSFRYPDLNGDGKADICARDSAGVQCWLSTGTGFGPLFVGPAWATDGAPEFEFDQYGGTVRYADLNGDGKADVCARDTAGIVCYLGTGNGFTAGFRGPNWSDAAGWNQPKYYGTIQFVDLNGDGKADICGRGVNGITCAMSTGSGFLAETAGPAWSDAGGWGAEQYYSTIQFADFDGNGKSDVMGRSSTALTAQNANTFPNAGDLLASVENGIGGRTSLTYVPSTNWVNTYLPQGMLFQTVNAVSLADGRGDVQATNYAYAGARWYSPDREFLGFRKATTTIGATGAYSESYYWQRAGTIAKPEVIYKRKLGGAIMSFDKFAFTENALPPYTSLMTEGWGFECNGDAVVDANHNYVSGCRRVLTTYEWDTYANLTRENQHGDYDLSGDERTAVRTFVPNLTQYIVGLPAYENMYAGLTTDAGALLHGQRFRYDGATDYLTAPVVGALTAKGEWNSQNGTYVEHAYAYDSFGNMTSLTDPLGKVSRKLYETTYNLYVVGTQNAAGHTTSMVYDYVLGMPTSQTDVNGAVSLHTYDALGRPTLSTGPDGSQVKVEYVQWGQPTAQRVRTSKLMPGSVWAYEDAYFDGLGRPYLAVDQSGVRAETIYGATGQPWKRSVPYVTGETVRYDVTTYDEVGRTLTVTHASGLTMTTAYGDNSVAVTDALGHTRTNFFDAAGRVTLARVRVDGADRDTTFYYDRLGRRTKSVDALGNQTVAVYDSMGRILQRSDPDKGLWTYGHDALGRVTAETDALGKTSTVAYDSLGRATRRTYSDGTYDVFTFDQVGFGSSTGRLTTAVSASGTANAITVQQYYDNMGRRTRYTTQLGTGTVYTLGHSYDLVGRLVTATYPDGEVVTYGYGTTPGLQFGRLISVSGSVAGTLVSNITYTSKGQTATLTHANGVTTTISLDASGERVNSINVGTLASLAYGYDANGQVTSITSPQFLDWTFAHDDLGRLTQATNTDGSSSRSFTYDALGRMLSNSALGGYSYGAATHVHAVTIAGSNTYAYDANGNMTSGGGRVLTYNLDHQPNQITNGSVVTQFTYDPLGVRALKDKGYMRGRTFISQVKTRYVGGLYEDKAGVVTKHYFAGAMRIAKRTGTANTYFHQDHLGSTRLVTNQSGAVVKQYDYAPYGAVVAESGTEVVAHRFTGQEADDETGLLFFNARYYDPALGRFIQPDSVLPAANDPQALDLYTYANNSPVNFIDPSGHAVVVAIIAAVVEVAGAVGAFVAGLSTFTQIAMLVVGAALTFSDNPVLQTIGMVMASLAGAALGGGTLLGLSPAQSIGMAGLVALAQSPISPLDSSVKKAIGWAYTAWGFVSSMNCELNPSKASWPKALGGGDYGLKWYNSLANSGGWGRFAALLIKEAGITAITWAGAYASSGWGTGGRWAAAFLARTFQFWNPNSAGPLSFVSSTYGMWYMLKYPDGQVIDLTGGAGGETFTFYYHAGFESWVSFGRQHVRVGDPNGGYWELGDTRAGWFGPGLGFAGWITTQKITVIMTPAQAAAFRGALQAGATAGGRYEGYHKDSYAYVSLALQFATGVTLADLHISPGLINW